MKKIPTVNMHQAKTHLSRLVDQAANGAPFILAKAGKPLVKVVPVDAPAPSKVRRLHNDPLDRTLIAQALVEGITLLTLDPLAAQYPGSVLKV